MKHLGAGLVWGLIGYFILAIGSYLVILLLSSNKHDRQQEAGMSSIFFFGPAGAIVAFFIGLFWSLFS